MNKPVTILFIISVGLSCAQNTNDTFNKITNDSQWQLKFKDNATGNWNKKWILDGRKANVKNTTAGMVFSAGPIPKDDSCHAVLWTKAAFNGAIKIEYDYTRIDTLKQFVNILYIQATGMPPRHADIMQWKEERTIPAMHQYFDKMKCLHISYAAFGNNEDEYIRARHYPRPENSVFSTTTEIAPSYVDSGLFIPGTTYKITVIKKDNMLYMMVRHDQTKKLFHWKLLPKQNVVFGRIGLRHMYTRVSRYSNFKIYTFK